MQQRREKRIPSDFARVWCQRLQHAGDLGVLIGILEDHREALKQRIDARLTRLNVANADEVADFHRHQGALLETGRIITTFETLGRGEEAEEMPLDALFSRPARGRAAATNGRHAKPLVR